MTHDIFISYGREDSEVMQRVDQALREAGLMTWTDHGIHPGSPSWKLDIETAIEEARCIVVLFSPDSADSRWVRAELDYAEAQGKPIYPLLVRGDATNAIPFGFTSYQWIDVRNPGRLNAGLERLIATLKDVQASKTDTPSRTALTASRRPRPMLPVAIGILLAALVLGILLIISIPQATPDTTPTDPANLAQVLPTALPTMPPFVLPDGYKKIEGDKTIIAVPATWAKEDDTSIIVSALGGNGGQTAARHELIQSIIDTLDIFGVNYLSAQAIVISVENIGFAISNDMLEKRQPSYFASFDPQGTFSSGGWVDMPAGKMLYSKGDVSDKTTFTDEYTLIRGNQLYHISINGRLVDRDKLEQIGQQIAQSFRVKE